MADSGGHWKNLAEAQKLTQSLKIPGVFEEDIKRNNPIERFPVGQAAGTGLKIEWLREKVVIEDDVVETEIGDQLLWTDDVEYEEKEMTLRRMYIQRKLDKYVQGIYGTFNNYEERVLLESEKGLKRKLGARAFYGDTTYGGTPAQFDGLHALAAEHGTPYTAGSAYDPKNIDGGEAGLSLGLLRVLVDEMKHGVDEILAPYEIIRRMDAAYQERGFTWAVSSDMTGNLAFLTMGYNDLGKRVLFWDGIPIVRTDYLVGEEANTGTGASSDKRGLYSSDKQYSLFGVKYGMMMDGEQNPGIQLAYGGTEGQGDLYKLVRFPELEDYDAGGIRLVTYGAILLGSSLCLGRIFDIEDVAITI